MINKVIKSLLLVFLLKGNIDATQDNNKGVIVAGVKALAVGTAVVLGSNKVKTKRELELDIKRLQDRACELKEKEDLVEKLRKEVRTKKEYEGLLRKLLVNKNNRLVLEQERSRALKKEQRIIVEGLRKKTKALEMTVECAKKVFEKIELDFFLAKGFKEEYSFCVGKEDKISLTKDNFLFHKKMLEEGRFTTQQANQVVEQAMNKFGIKLYRFDEDVLYIDKKMLCIAANLEKFRMT